MTRIFAAPRPAVPAATRLAALMVLVMMLAACSGSASEGTSASEDADDLSLIHI